MVASARYEYTRGSNYQVSASGKEVKMVTVHEHKYEVLNGHIHVPVIEHCLQELREESFTDGISGKDTPALQQFLAMAPLEVSGQLRDEVGEQAILVPPQVRISAIMRASLSRMITGIQADSILDEQVAVSRVDLTLDK